MPVSRHRTVLLTFVALATLVGCSASNTGTGVIAATTTTTTTTTVSHADSNLDEQLQAIPTSEITQEEIDGLLWMREEEKLAHDVYVKLYDLWGLRPFANIAESELTHTESVLTLLDRYDIADPVGDNTVGIFVDPTLQSLYDDLIAQGSVSVEAALTVGVMIEELDIVDLQQRATDIADIQLVYANLEKGSRNHLRAFMRTLDRYDVQYEPQYLPADEFDAIASSETETGPAADG